MKNTQEQTVVVHFSYGSTDLQPVFELQRRLEAAISLAAAGEFDGNEVSAAGTDGFLYMYGPDADQLFAVIQPILESTSFMRGAEVTKRYGAAGGGGQEEVLYIGDGTPLPREKQEGPARRTRASRRRKPTSIEVCEGDIFAVALLDGSQAIGQVVGILEERPMVLAAFYSYRIPATDRLTEVFPLTVEDIIAVEFLNKYILSKGQWPTIGRLPAANTQLRSMIDAVRRADFVGLSWPNGPTVEAFLNAYHGLAPWIIGTDEGFLTRMRFSSDEFGRKHR